MTTGHDAGPDLTGDQRTSIGELLGEVTTNLSDLIRQEMDLAKAELRQSTTRVGKGAAMLGGAGVAADLMLVFGSVAAWWAIGNATGRGWSGLIVAGAWAIISLVLALMGRQAIRSARGLSRTAETARRIPGALLGDEPGHRGPASDRTVHRTRTRSGPAGTNYPGGSHRPTTMDEEGL